MARTPASKDKPDLLNLTDPFGRRIGGSSQIQGNQALTIQQILTNWQKEHWMPCGQMLFGAKFMYFKNEDRLVCIDSSKGEVQWLGFRTQYPQPNFSKIIDLDVQLPRMEKNSSGYKRN